MNNYQCSIIINDGDTEKHGDDYFNTYVSFKISVFLL